MSDNSILLGYEIRTGSSVNIPLRHLAVTGQTQESGKTTTLEALVSRSHKPAIAFVTKRGERSFSSGHRVPPYFRDRADWQFVCSIIDATLQEKNKFLRPWIMRICRTTHTLNDVQREVKLALTKAQGINESVYTQLDAYLDLIIPEISRIPMTPGIRLKPGLNVMDVSHFATPMQMLFVQSALDWINQHERDTIVIVPEAWEFVPEGKSSPVKAPAISLVRKGAGLGNFIWVDSQDMAGVDKTILRGCTVWLIGVQREANEIKRNLANIPAGIQRPKPADIARLDKGQFYACWKDRTAKVYVAPAWMAERDAWSIATGRRRVEEFSPPPAEPLPELEFDPTSIGELFPQLEVESTLALIESTPLSIAQTEPQSNGMAHLPALESTDSQEEVDIAPIESTPQIDEEELYQRFKLRLISELPTLLQLMVDQPEIEVVVKRKVIRLSEKTLQGQLAKMISEGCFSTAKSSKVILAELKRRRFAATKTTIDREVAKLVQLGYLDQKGDKYVAVAKTKIKTIMK